MKFGCSNITTEEVIAKINGIPFQKNMQSENSEMVNINSKYNTKITSCKACGKEISRSARKCPHCGHPTASEQLGQAVKGVVLAPFLLIAIIIAICFYFGVFSGLIGILH